jgi:hypothetical protein
VPDVRASCSPGAPSSLRTYGLAGASESSRAPWVNEAFKISCRRDVRRVVEAETDELIESTDPRLVLRLGFHLDLLGFYHLSSPSTRWA